MSERENSGRLGRGGKWPGGNGAPTLSQSISTSGGQPTNQFTRVSYDTNGNVTAYGPPPAATLGYDVANRLATVSSSNAYAYDPANQRAYFRNTAGSETLYFYGLGGKKLATYTIAPSGSQVNFTFLSRNIYFAGKLISAEGKAVSVDRLGSVRWNATAGNHTYYPYGAEYSATSNDTEKYASYTRDSLTGLDYAMNRYYSSAWGRFMTPDPTWRSASLSDPQSWNRYMYALGDPIAGSDPTGLDDVDGNDGCPDGVVCTFGGGGDGGACSGQGCGDGDGNTCATGSTWCTTGTGTECASGATWCTTGTTEPPEDPTPEPPEPDPDPDPLAPNPPGPAPSATCTLGVYDRPLDYFILRNTVGLHGFVDFTNQSGTQQIIEGLHTGNLLTATMNGAMATGHFDGAISSPYVCAALPILQLDVNTINGANIAYYGLGPNSSSVLRYLLQSLWFLTDSWYSIPIAMQLTGYYALLPGIETAPPAPTPSPRPQPIRPPRYHY